MQTMKPSKTLTERLYGQKNYLLLFTALLVIAVGYVCLAVKPKDGLLTMNVAPVLLVLGYCVLMPITLFLKPGNRSTREIQKPVQK